MIRLEPKTRSHLRQGRRAIRDGGKLRRAQADLLDAVFWAAFFGNVRLSLARNLLRVG